jgi:hypothetical protein
VSALTCDARLERESQLSKAILGLLSWYRLYINFPTYHFPSSAVLSGNLINHERASDIRQRRIQTVFPSHAAYRQKKSSNHFIARVYKRQWFGTCAPKKRPHEKGAIGEASTSERRRARRLFALGHRLTGTASSLRESNCELSCVRTGIKT